MKFIDYIKDSIDYTFDDRFTILIISSLITISCIINKNSLINPVWKVFNILLLVVVGYGSYVTWYTPEGEDTHPLFKNNLKDLVLEGFKKSLIIFAYSLFLHLIAGQAKQEFVSGNLIIAACWTTIFVLPYFCLITGLLNRYLNEGKFRKAFHLVEIINLMMQFDIKSFIKVVIAVITAQTFAALIIIDFSEGFTTTELIYSIATFFLAPFLYIAAKRLVALNMYDLLEKHDPKRKKNNL